MLDRKDFEIMAPAGSWESLTAAVNSGADSIYLGAGCLNMRAGSSHQFKIDELKDVVAFCSERGVKVYLTVNAVLFDSDLAEMQAVIDAAKEFGISAIIASDVAALKYCRQVGIPVHLSTQLNIANIDALEFYSPYADVVVLARELNLSQVKEIFGQISKRNIRGPSGELVRIEMFCHGALCMAVSGKCYMSLHNANRSANRGECMQVCRRAYVLKDKERDTEIEVDNQYLMSPKDLKTIGFMDLMVDAGVQVFKIEGRARGSDYVATTVSCYAEALQAVIDGKWNEQISKRWDERLSSVYNRGFWNGYYLGQRLGEWSKRYGSQATERKIYAGKAVNYYAKPGVAQFYIQASTLNKGDKLLITGPSTGAVYTDLSDPWVDMKSVEEVHQGDTLTCKVPVKVRENDKLYKVVKTTEELRQKGNLF
ncbi:MAG: U32 family peptidase [Burkholderiales bacterium]|nr:U32 family peptidase [Burkholderiales bacterium]